MTSIRTKKLSNGFEIPVLGIGTYKLGGRTSNDREEIDAIRRAIELGYTHIDTAEKYGDPRGHTEKLVGEAIKDVNRENLFITTKVSDANLRYDAVLKSAEISLERMGIDYVNLFLIHRAHKSMAFEDTLRAMNKLVERGRAKNIGVSNFNFHRIKEAQEAQAKLGSRNRIAVNQIKYNLWEPARTETIMYCQNNDIMIVAHTPFNRWEKNEADRTYKDKTAALSKLSHKHGKTEAQIVLNWLISQKNVVAIPGASNALHIKENLGALEFSLSQEEQNALTSSIETDLIKEDIGFF